MAESDVVEPDVGETRRNLAALAANAFLRGAHNSIYTVIWQPFVLSLGASMPTLGVLNSLGGMSGIVTTLAQPLGGWSADRLGRKPFILASSLAIVGGYGLFAAAGWLNIWTFLILGVVSLGLSALSRPALASITAESVRGEAHGRAFSLTSFATVVPGIVAPMAGGLAADHLGYIIVFPICILLETASLVIIWRYLRENRPKVPNPIRMREAAGALARSVIPVKGMVGFFCANAGDSFSWGLGWGLIYGMATEAYHLSAEQLGIMASVMSLSWALMQMPIGRYVDHHGTRGMLIFSETIGIPLMLIWLTQTRYEILLASEVLFALTAATWVPVVSTYLASQVKAEERAEAFGRLNAFRGLVAFPAPAIGGLLYAWGGMALPLIANLVGCAIVMVILALFVPERVPLQIAQAELSAAGGE